MSTLRANTLQNANGTRTRGTCWAWVNFTSITATAITGSFNVSSLIDNGTGDTTINFTTALADANYAVALGNISPTTALTSNNLTVHGDNTNPTLKSTTQLRVFSGATNTGTPGDQGQCSVVIMGN